jgi:hypothetical protein
MPAARKRSRVREIAPQARQPAELTPGGGACGVVAETPGEGYDRWTEHPHRRSDMKTLTILLLVLTPAIVLTGASTAARADKSFTGGKGGTWDCAKDPTVVINTGNGTYTFKGACKSISVNGGSNKLTIAGVDELNLTGAKNKIDVDEVGAINIIGTDNAIRWKKTKSGDKPDTSVVGNGNTIDKAK